MTTLLARSTSHRSLALHACLWAASAFAGCAPSDFDRRHESEPSRSCDADAAALDGAACPSSLDDEYDDVGDGALANEAGPADMDESDSSKIDRAEDAAPEDAERSQPEHDAEACIGCAPEPGDAQTASPDAAAAVEDAGDGSSALCPSGPPVCMVGERGAEMRGCGACGAGMQMRTRACAMDGCSWGAWSAWSACAGVESECAPGQVERASQACGSCGAGTQTRTRSCSATTCSWGAWGAWSACSGAVTQCTPGQMETQTEACGACNTGSHTRTRRCSASSCTWEAWGAFGACGGVTAACTPGQTAACSPADSCGHRVCSNSCSWSGCVPRVANGCLRRRNGSQEEGSNYRCCGDSRWQFCLPSCQWSADCGACSAANCEC